MTLQEIEDAINEDRVCIYIQPIYSIKDERFVSAEILARIIDKDGKIILPNEFIPVAEQTKVMFFLELKILQKICSTLICPEIQALNLDYVEINFSAKNTEKKKFLKKVQDIIDINGISHNTFNIEITESAIPQNKNRFFKNLNILRDNDFRISLDDFGMGFNNFQYLLNIPAKLVKLDMSLIQSAFKNEKSIPIIHGITLITHAIGSRVVAEGIEDEKTYQLLKDLGVDYIQGYYFSKPLPVQDFISFMKENQK